MKEPSSDELHTKQPYSLPDPYPKPRVTAENHYYASLLLEDYAGIAGELTAINQYIYHYITLQANYPEISILAREVAITEMKHLELIGKTIQLLGKRPIMRCNQDNVNRFWSAKFVYYGKDVYDKLSANIQHEMNAICNYRNHQRHIADPRIQELLERIILDEKYHLELFSQCRNELSNKFY
jgi:bacterioferritin